MKNKTIHNVINISINCGTAKEGVLSDYSQRDNTTRILDEPELISPTENVVGELSEDLDEICMVPTPRVYRAEIEEPTGITVRDVVPGLLAVAALVGILIIG